MNVLMIVCAVLIVALVIITGYAISTSKKVKRLEQDIRKRDNTITALNEQVIMYREASEEKERIRNETEKKIDDLHNGDGVDNAINVLRDGKNRN